MADLILLIHVLIVAFNAGGLVAIWIGAWLDWGWVRNRVFRIVHLSLMAFVAVEALLGVTCPLTVWEDALRGAVTERSFVSRWLAAFLYWDLPPAAFTAIYAGWTLVIVAAWFLVPPRARTPAAR